MEFVDKIEEQQRLIKTLNNEKPTFIMVYGRPNGTCPPNQFVGKRVSTPFMDFYFHFVVPNRSLIELGRSAFATDAIRSQFSRYASARWKKLCYQAVNGRVIGGEMYNLARRW